MEGESDTVRDMFRKYATGTATSAQPTIWLNDQGFHTRNTKKLPGPDGMLVSGSRLFTVDSLKGILHNAFCAGLVKHKSELYPVSHEVLITKETFDLAQMT